MEKLKNNIASLKELLPHGSLKEIAQKSNTTIFTVSRVFNGKSKNAKVYKAIREYIKDLNDGSNEIEMFLSNAVVEHE